MRITARPVLFLALAVLFAPAARAGVVGIDASTATVMQQHQSSFSGLGLRARIHDSRLIDNIEFMPYFEYWRNTSTVQPFNIRASRSDATLGADVRYVMEWRGVHPYAGVGLGLHFLDNQVEAPSLGLPYGQNSLIKGGVAVLGGASFALAGHLQNFIEVKYHHVPDYGQVKIAMGLAYQLH
jgi:hypothetical protein